MTAVDVCKCVLGAGNSDTRVLDFSGQVATGGALFVGMHGVVPDVRFQRLTRVHTPLYITAHPVRSRRVQVPVVVQCDLPLNGVCHRQVSP